MFAVLIVDTCHLHILTRSISAGPQMDNQVVVSDYAAMDRVLREERQYLLNIVKQIKKSGCNVLLVQKSILRSVAEHVRRVDGRTGGTGFWQ